MTLGLESAVGNLDESINYAASQDSVHRINDQILSNPSNKILSEDQQSQNTKRVVDGS